MAKKAGDMKGQSSATPACCKLYDVSVGLGFSGWELNKAEVFGHLATHTKTNHAELNIIERNFCSVPNLLAVSTHFLF